MTRPSTRIGVGWVTSIVTVFSPGCSAAAASYRRTRGVVRSYGRKPPWRPTSCPLTSTGPRPAVRVSSVQPAGTTVVVKWIVVPARAARRPRSSRAVDRPRYRARRRRAPAARSSSAGVSRSSSHACRPRETARCRGEMAAFVGDRHGRPSISTSLAAGAPTTTVVSIGGQSKDAAELHGPAGLDGAEVQEVLGDVTLRAEGVGWMGSLWIPSRSEYSTGAAVDQAVRAEGGVGGPPVLEPSTRCSSAQRSTTSPPEAPRPARRSRPRCCRGSGSGLRVPVALQPLRLPDHRLGPVASWLPGANTTQRRGTRVERDHDLGQVTDILVASGRGSPPNGSASSGGPGTSRTRSTTSRR